MKDKVIVELELLTPLKYKECANVFTSSLSSGSGLIRKIVEVRSNKLMPFGSTVLTNTQTDSNRLLTKITSKFLSEAEECVLIDSSELTERRFKKLVDFRGLHELERSPSHVCAFTYLVKNINDNKVKNTLRTEDRKIFKYYVKRTDVDEETADVFSDIYNSL